MPDIHIEPPPHPRTGTSGGGYNFRWDGTQLALIHDGDELRACPVASESEAADDQPPSDA